MPGGGGNLGTISTPRFNPRNRIERRVKHPISARDIAKNTMTQVIIESNANIQRLEKQVIELTARNAILEKSAN